MEEKIEETTTNEKKVAARGSKSGLIVLVGVLVLVALGAWFGRGLFTTTSAATVNEEVITRAEYNARVGQIEKQYELQLAMGGGEGSVEDPETQAQMRSAAMDELVNERLFLQAAKAAGIEVGGAEVDSELLKQKESYPDEASYEADLAAAGVTESQLKQNIQNQLTIIAYARSVIPEADYVVTDEELQEIYNLNFADADTTAEGIESEVPTFEEFSSANREQFELQKLGMAVGPLIEELRANAEIKIFVDLSDIENAAVPPEATIEPEAGVMDEVAEPLVDDDQVSEGEVFEDTLPE
jgi:hypothetical protein